MFERTRSLIEPLQKNYALSNILNAQKLLHPCKNLRKGKNYIAIIHWVYKVYTWITQLYRLADLQERN